MFRVVPSGRSGHVRTLLIAVALFGLLGSIIPMASGQVALSGAPHSVHALPTGSSNLPLRPAADPLSSRPSPPSLAPTSTPSSTHPAGAGTGTGTFWIANSSFSSVSFANDSCSFYSSYYYFDSDCDDQAVSPTLLNLSNGDVAVVFSVYTNASGTSCLGSASYVRERVAFAISTNGGLSFGPMEFLGNLTCSYLDAIEPSFVVGPDGTIYGVYVEENYSDNQGYYTERSNGTTICYYSYYYGYYCYSTGGDGVDAIGFTESTNNGASFSAPVTILSGGNISKPQLAISGQSLYVLYENDANGTAYLDYGQYGRAGYPISENLLFSSNSGGSWGAPSSLPGLNASVNNTAFGGAIAVDAAGMVGVAYFTNHSCVGTIPFYTCWDYGDELVYTTSTTNGSTWAALTDVKNGVGESFEYTDGFYMDAAFQMTPQAALSFDSAGLNAYITWSGDYNKTALNHQPYDEYDNWVNAGIFAAVGPISGSAFVVTMVQGATSDSDYDQSFNPSIATSSGTIYVAYTSANSTYCSRTTCISPLDGSYVEFLQSSTDGGLTWSSPVVLSYSNDCYYGYCSPGYASSSFAGYSSSLLFNASGSPIVAYALPGGFHDVYTYYGGVDYYNYTYPTTLSVASIWTGPTVALNFSTSGLSPGTAWSFSVDGNSFATTLPYFNVTNVPLGQNVSIVAGTVGVSGWGIISTPTLSVPGSEPFFVDTHVFINYSVSYLLTLSIEPTNPRYAEIWFDSHLGLYYYFEEYNDCPFSCLTQETYQSTGDWYFPANSTLELNSSADYPQEALDYWTGTGNGSHTGAGAKANITFDAPINETAWLGGFGDYNLSISAIGLAASSTYHFELDGAPYSGTGDSTINVSGVGTGAHELTDAWATSSTAGWEYFGGLSEANPVLVPTETSVQLVFALVDLAAAPGTVSFQAQGLTAGTVWNFQFNGSIYSSDTPWINVTTHPGTYPDHGFDVVSENASTGYAPSGVGPTVSVTTGSTYPVSFVSAYKVEVVAGTGGGVVSGTGSFWVAAGGSAQYVASPHTGYGFGGWTGTGVGGYTGLSIYANLTVNGPIAQSASFYPLPGSRFNLTFAEVGLAQGTWWTVFLGGTGYSTNESLLEIQNLLPCGTTGGTYNLTVPYAYATSELTRYLPTSHLPKAVCTTGVTSYNEVFTAEFYLTLQSTAGGFAEAQVGANSVSTSLWVASGTSVSLSAVGQLGYDFLGWNGSGPGNYTGALGSESIIMAGPISELATFSLHVNPPPPTYTETFHEEDTLAAGTVWGILLAGVGYSSTSPTLSVSGLTAGTYSLTVTTALSPDGQTRYSPLGNPASVTVAHNASILVSYSTSYWVSVTGTTGGTTIPGSNWVTSGESILLNVTVYGGYVFLGWNGSGAASYSGLDSQTTLTVSSPVREVATFAPIAQTVSTGAAGSSALWGQPTTWIGLGLVGLVIGLVVGVVVSRRGGRAPPAISSYDAPLPADDGALASGELSPPEGGGA
jgi:List-Bact-rpt repeat protein